MVVGAKEGRVGMLQHREGGWGSQNGVYVTLNECSASRTGLEGGNRVFVVRYHEGG